MAASKYDPCKAMGLVGDKKRASTIPQPQKVWTPNKRAIHLAEKKAAAPTSN